MKKFNITSPNEAIKLELQDKIDNLTKPKGSLGTLEELALQIGYIQQSLSPTLIKPHHVVFAADHGIVDENISASPKEVTRQMVYNFLEGGAGINFLARQHNFDLKIVDSGVDYDFGEECSDVIDMKIRRGTRNYLHKSAMTHEECDNSIACGAKATDLCAESGCNVISFGEMGITNTSSSAVWMSLLCDIPLCECVGAGSDNTGKIVAHKYSVLSRAIENYEGDRSAEDIMRYFGGYEMVMAVGAMLRAAELGLVIIIDGFIMTACALMASKLYPSFLEYAIFGHCGDEVGHKLLLDQMDAKPILHLGLRLGEGTGAICAYPIIESAVRMICEMSSFQKVA
ncbi:MAG: nicotinate-nucleotide--dimethylbenzimidazole phosphoribosyltransferase, partial [Rikenellaceae bacterium]